MAQNECLRELKPVYGNQKNQKKVTWDVKQAVDQNLHDMMHLALLCPVVKATVSGSCPRRAHLRMKYHGRHLLGRENICGKGVL